MLYVVLTVTSSSPSKIGPFSYMDPSFHTLVALLVTLLVVVVVVTKQSIFIMSAPQVSGTGLVRVC